MRSTTCFALCAVAAGLSLLGCAPAPAPLAPLPPSFVPPQPYALPQGDPKIFAVEQRSRLAERMVQLRVPGVSVAVIEHGTMIWARGYGILDATSAARVTPETLFQAASVSKAVTAMAAMRLVQDGRIGLDADVNTQLRSWRLQSEVPGPPATLRMLLSHTAGVTVHGFRGYAPGEPVPTLLDVLEGRRPANSKPIRVDEPPGSKERYSGGGFVVVEALLDDVERAPFDAIVRRTLFQPLGMTHSTFAQPLPYDWTPYAASGHHENGAPIPGRFFTYPEHAAAGLWTTPSDLARVLIEMQAAMVGSGRVLSQPIAAVMLTRQKTSAGLGFGLAGSGDHLRFSKGGSNVGYRAGIEAVLRTGQGAVVMTNGDAGGHLVQEITQAIAAEYGWPDKNEAPRLSFFDEDEDDARVALGEDDAGHDGGP